MFVVRTLLYAEVFNLVGNVFDRSKDRVNGNLADGCTRILVFLSGAVTTAFANGQFDVELDVFVEVANYEIRVGDIVGIGVTGNVAGEELPLHNPAVQE